MPAVLDPKPAPAPSKFDEAVRTTLADTGRKIRANDAVTGGLVVAAIALGYAVAVVLLDRWLDLPAWVRQVGFLGLLAAVGTAGWYLVVRPYRRQVNPRYVARQVEGTIPDAKNAVINWVDLHDRDIPGSVRSSLGAKAAAGLADADPADAVPGSRMAWAGGVVAALVGVLAVLFLLYKSQFLSLLGRAFNPFSSKAIATRTTIDLLDPTGDLTVTDGQQIGFSVRVTGNIPAAGSPEQVRLKVRYAEGGSYDEYPLERGDSLREYSFTAGRSVIQNGFWYRVAAGDAETPEYRVTVRTRPMIKGWETKYEYPEYLRLKPDAGLPDEPRINGFRGTKVALTVKTNRTVASGTLTTTIGTQETPLGGVVVGENRDSLRFDLVLRDKGTYVIDFKSIDKESSGPTVPYPIDVYVDQPPTVTLVKPEQEEIVLPTTGLLAVDAKIEDDHGIASAKLMFRLANGPAVAPKPFRDGKSFKRDTDGSFPRDLDYKDSVKLDALKTADGKPVALQPDTVLEYWVEATDNYAITLDGTALAPNVGKSKVQRVRLTKPEADPMKRQEQQNQQQQRQQQRQGEEQQNNQKTDDKNQTEKRDTPPPENRDKGQGEKGQGDPQQQPGGQGEKDPNKQPENPEKQPNPMGQGNDPNKQPPEKQPNPADADATQKAEDLQNKIDEENRQGGAGKGDPDQKRNNMPEEQPAQGKGGSKNQPPLDAGQEKEQPKPGEDPNGADGGKGAGEVQQPKKAEDKPQPKPGEDPNGDPNAAPKEGPKPNDQEGTGQQKSSGPQPGQAEPPPLKPGEKPRDTDAAGGKGSGEEPKDPAQPQPQPKPGEKDGPQNAGQSKPSGDVSRGDQKKPQPGQQGNPNEAAGQPDPSQQPGDARGKEPVKQGAAKPNTDKGQPMAGKPDAAEGKEPPKADGDPMKGGDETGAGKGEGAKPDPKTDPDAKPVDKGMQKPAGDGKGGQPDPAQRKEIEDAARDLGSDDPAKRDAAREKLDKTVGPDARKQAEQIADDMKSGDPKRQEDAKRKLDDLAKQAGKNGQGGKPEKLTPEQKEKLADAAKDLNNPDPDKRQAAEKKADDLIGKDQREKLQQQMKDFDKNVQDLGSDDKATRDAAKERLDKTVGKDVREKAEKAVADKKSADEKTRAEAERKAKELAKEQAGKKANDPNAKPPELTEKEKKELADAARDLADKNDDKRKAAEQKLDEQIGKDAREELQQDLKDLTGNDPEKAKAAREKLEQAAKEAKQREEQEWKLGGVPPKGPAGKPLEDNPENRLKAAELQLDDFKKHKDNPEFLKKAGYSKEEYEKFLKGFEEMVGRQRGEVEQAKAARAAGTEPRLNVSDGSGANARLTGPTAQPGGPGAGGAGQAPPGFEAAHKRFIEEALKNQPKK